MSINFDNFVAKPGLVNKQGRLPDPSELVCIEIPKVFDQCLIKRCLVYDDGPDTNSTDAELRSLPLKSPKLYIGSRDFTIRLNSVERIPLNSNPDFKKLIISYTISFYSDYIDTNSTHKTEFYEINRTDEIGKFYCPDSLSSQASTISPQGSTGTCEDNIIKLEMVASALQGLLTTDENGCDVLDITLGYYIIVKCELIVQLLIPAYDYCPVPKKPCDPEPEKNACEIFEKAPVPKFYPDQNLSPLFTDTDDSKNAKTESQLI